MSEYLLLLIGTVFVNNIVLAKFLGLCPFMGVSRKLETAIGMALATTFVLTLSSVSSYLVNEYVLAPLDLEYMRTIMFILVIAVVVQFTEMVVHKTSPLLYNVLGIFLPLITTNCAVLGVALVVVVGVEVALADLEVDVIECMNGRIADLKAAAQRCCCNHCRMPWPWWQ